MSLKDFENIQNGKENEKKETKKIFIEQDISIETIKYYLTNIDELITLVEKYNREYANAKLDYELKKDEYQISINWNEENALRTTNDLPKITNQNQRDSVINLKLKNKHIKMKDLELKSKFYSKIFSFINNNYETLFNLYGIGKKSKK